MKILSTKFKVLILLSFLALTSLVVTSSMYAQESLVKPIRLVTGEFTPAMIPPGEVTVSPETTFDGKYFKLIQFAEIPDEHQQKAWQDAGLHLVDYLPDDTYFAVIDQKFDLNRLTDDVLTIIDVDEIFKVEPELANLRAQGEAKDKLIVSYYFSLDAQKVISDLESRGVVIENHRDYSCQLDIVIDATQLDEIVALPYIQFVGSQLGEPELESFYSNSTGRSNYLNTGYLGLLYNGTGVVIAIGEGGTVGDHIDFRGRLTELSSGDPGSHKIGSMRNAGGGGNLDPTERNNAWGASLLSVSGTPDYAALYTSHSLRFTNHSYGFGVSGGYDSTARNHDLRTASHPYHLISYSSGNVGTSTGYAPYDGFSGWANITGQPKQNKNHFAIRNLLGDDTILTWGSKGPAYDGRILPHLTIEGSAGTSYASPKIVGLMAILAEVYKDNNGGAEAPANLLRAILMNTADDMDDPGPDFKTGYGRPNVRRAYEVIANAQFLSDDVSNGGLNTHTLIVPAGTTQVRVMLMWPDVAASVNANPAIVNNLNLLLEDPPATSSYNPWVLDHTPNPTNLDLPATRQVDNLNTMEQVTVDNPAAGAWTVEVSGANVPFGPQTYYIVYEFLMDELYMGFPLADVQLEPGETYNLKWDSYGSSSTFALDYQIDGGSWVNIVTGYDATSRNYQWTTPAVIPGIHTLAVRVRRDALTATSGTNYLGEVPKDFALDWACGTDARLTWSAVSGATSYKVYRLGTQSMEEVVSGITFDGTSAIVSGLSTTADEHFAVSAVTAANEGQRTMALTKTAGDYNCFIIKTTVAGDVDKTDMTLNGLVNPHNTTLTNVHFEYGPTAAYGSSTANIPTSATGHAEEMVNATIASSLASRTDMLHYRLVADSDGTTIYGDDQVVQLAPGSDFTFDGTDDYIDVSQHGALPIYKNGAGNAYSIAMWVKGGPQNDMRVYTEGHDGTNTPLFAVGTDTAGRLRVFIRSDGNATLLSATSTATVFDDTWHHIAWVDSNGTATLYVDGQADATSFNYTPSTLTLNQAAIGAVLRASSSNYFTGRIDEISQWDKALSSTEVRALMHQPLTGAETDLVAYYHLDGVATQAFDMVSGVEAEIVGGTTKTTSSVPFGVGAEHTAAEAPGTVVFTGTDLEVDYINQTGASVIVSIIEVEPNALNGFSGGTTVFDEQYWVVHRHGTGSFLADLAVATLEDLTAADESTPAQIQLFGRDKGSDGAWNFVSVAGAVDATNDWATFYDITAFDQQFIVVRNTDPLISVDQDSLEFRNTKVGCGNQQQSYALSGINLTNDLVVTPPSGLLVSTDTGSGFATSLSLTPVDGLVQETIYVRFSPASAGSVSGNVTNSSTGATTVNVNIPAFGAFDLADNASQAMTFDGANDQLVVSDLNWNPNSLFSVEWWLNPDTHNSWNQQIGNGWGAFLFHTNSSGVVSAGVASNSWSRINSPDGTMVVGEWQHFAFTINGSHAKLYRNGELLGEMTGSDRLDNLLSTFDIGKTSSSTIDGEIDELRIWSTERTQQEIRDNMHNVLSGSETGLKVYLQFNAETGEVVDFSNECHIIDANNGPGRTASTAPVGTVGEFVNTQTPTSVGDTGKHIQVTITSTPDDDNFLGIYRTGPGDSTVSSGETFPSGVVRRWDILWGVQEYGAVTADMVIDYSNVSGITDPTAIRLLKRTDAVSAWTDVTADFVHDDGARTFSRAGVTDFSEFSIGDDGSNPTAAGLVDFTASPVSGGIRLNWETATEIDNVGFNLYRSESVNGPVTRLNTALIPSQSPGAPTGAVYTWLDENVTSGVTYFYWLEDVDIHSVATRHGPVSTQMLPRSLYHLYLPMVLVGSK